MGYKKAWLVKAHSTLVYVHFFLLEGKNTKWSQKYSSPKTFWITENYYKLHVPSKLILNPLFWMTEAFHAIILRIH